jgi:hypothetical protein
MEHIGDLIHYTHWDDAYLWNLPIGYANWLRVLSLRSQGQDVDFVTEEEKKLQESLPDEFRMRTA